MASPLDLVLRPDGTPNLTVIIPTLVAVLVVGGAVLAVIRSRFGPPEPVAASDWAHAAYSIWTGGEDCGQWEPARARDALQSWYGVTEPQAFWSTIRGLEEGRTGSIAWDRVRALDLLRIGTAAGYIRQAECWQAVSSTADALRQRFDSWAALAADFEAGMHQWQDQRGVTDAQQRQKVQSNLPYLRKTAWPRAAFKAPLEL
jgi:hypothetical protein